VGKVFYINRSEGTISSIRPLGLSEKRWTWNQRKAGFNLGAAAVIIFTLGAWAGIAWAIRYLSRAFG